MPSPSPSPPPPPPMNEEEEEEEPMRCILEESAHNHDEAEWHRLNVMMALSMAGDVSIPELEMAVKEEVKEKVVEEPLITVSNPHLKLCSSAKMGAASRQRYDRGGGWVEIDNSGG
ncbi:hypothetical protein D1007_50442 [Hordeum vulgare]|nr:hypothetical protein D1007_50442 [Hordeum vulgare]